MNKKAIFIPLLLLAQPNQILSADNRFNQAQGEISKLMEGNKWLRLTIIAMVPNMEFVSCNPDVQTLLDSCRREWHGADVYPSKCIGVIKRYYPDADLQESLASIGSEIKGSEE